MGEPHWLEDPRFRDDISRGDHGEIISERLARWCAERTSEQVLTQMEEARLPAGPVMSPQDVLNDPHVAATGMLHRLDYPGLGQPAPVMGPPVSLSLTPPTIRHRAPTLGEHTDQLLTELGYTPEEIQMLRSERVV